MISLFCFISNIFAYNIKPYPEQNHSGLENKLNLVFCPLNYRDNEASSGDIKIFLQRLKQTKPFDELCNNLGFWYVNISAQEASKIFKATKSFPPLAVRRDFLADISAKLESEYKIIIIDATGSTSCAELSSIDKLSLIILGKARYKDEDSFAKGFLHELGHSLGLRDERVDGGQLCSLGPPNCAVTQEEAEKWWGDLVGKVSNVHYISGCCGNVNYIRPTIASLMNNPDKARDFGPVNERYLEKSILGVK